MSNDVKQEATIGHDGLPWPQTFDGHAWAVEFNKQFPSVSVDDALGWFCNAIMRGYDHASAALARAQEVVEAARTEIGAEDRLADVYRFQIRFASRSAYERARDRAISDVAAARSARITAVRAFDAARAPQPTEGPDA